MSRRASRRADDLVAAVEETLAAIPDRPEDAGARALARRYAAQIDAARAIAVELQAVPVDDDADARLVERLAKRVDAGAVLADLGPRLLAVLDALGATPRARAAAAPSAGGGASPDNRTNPLDGLRARSARLRDAATVDAAAP